MLKYVKLLFRYYLPLSKVAQQFAENAEIFFSDLVLSELEQTTLVNPLALRTSV